MVLGIAVYILDFSQPTQNQHFTWAAPGGPSGPHCPVGPLCSQPPAFRPSDSAVRFTSGEVDTRWLLREPRLAEFVKHVLRNWREEEGLYLTQIFTTVLTSFRMFEGSFCYHSPSVWRGLFGFFPSSENVYFTLTPQGCFLWAWISVVTFPFSSIIWCLAAFRSFSLCLWFSVVE